MHPFAQVSRAFCYYTACRRGSPEGGCIWFLPCSVDVSADGRWREGRRRLRVWRISHQQQKSAKEWEATRSRRGHLACNAAEDTCKPARTLPWGVCQQCIIIVFIGNDDWFTALGWQLEVAGILDDLMSQKVFNSNGSVWRSLKHFFFCHFFPQQQQQL